MKMVKITSDSEEEEFKFHVGVRLGILVLSMALLVAAHVAKRMDRAQEKLAKAQLEKLS